MPQPDIYIICDPHSKTGLQTLQETEQSLAKWHYSYQRWPQTQGNTVTDQTWQALNIKKLDQGKWQNRPGAWGCFVSHYRLWQRCRQQRAAMIILEHDALAQDRWCDDLDLDRCLWKLWSPRPTKYKPTVGHWNRGAWAYTLTAAQADRLITFTEKHGALALDKQLGSHAVDWQHYHRDLFIHNPRVRASTTSVTIHNK